MSRRYKKYVVGFNNDKNVIYGEDSPSFLSPMSKTKAVKDFIDMIKINEGCRHPEIVIYELVPIKKEHR